MSDQESNSEPAIHGEKARAVVESCMEELRLKTAALNGLVFSRMKNFNVDLNAGEIRFEMPDMIATGAVQIVGTYNIPTGTWLWGWKHPSVPERLARSATAVLEFGNEHGIAAITTNQIACTEQDCWEFTALACHLNDQTGGYRCPAGDTLAFTTFEGIKLSKAPAAVSKPRSLLQRLKDRFRQ